MTIAERGEGWCRPLRKACRPPPYAARQATHSGGRDVTHCDPGVSIKAKDRSNGLFAAGDTLAGFLQHLSEVNVVRERREFPSQLRGETAQDFPESIVEWASARVGQNELSWSAHDRFFSLTSFSKSNQIKC